MTTAPTHSTYSTLQDAYTHFNTRLFDGKLPPCLITLQRKGSRVMGYFSPKRFAARTGTARTDEIAMNPMHFRTRKDIEILQTLVHEMAHLWQAHFGKPSRAGYHNKEWARKMEAIGLMPSSTGKPGGATTGERMNDYVIRDGLFHQASQALLASGFRLEWYEPGAPVAASGMHDGAPAPSQPVPASGKRLTYQCPTCKARAWGKASLNLLCGVCHRAFEVRR